MLALMALQRGAEVRGAVSSSRAAARLLLPGLLTAVVLLASAHADEPAVVSELDMLAAELALKADVRVGDALPHIEGVGSRLLALRSYLRSGERLAERWSWTTEQIAAFEGSLEQQELQAEIRRVREVFERANPGYELFVNPQVRSLDIQLANWNRNESVAAASARLLRDVVAHLGADADDNAAREDSLAAFLISYTPEPIPTVAAPGLSPHGQMRAIDFQVHRGAEIVAGPDTQTIASQWDRGGWSARLASAVREASRKFIGPLASPREPWHYTYTPVVVAGE
jgi:hypothetical protein